jgi:hypothetical protein
MIVSSLASCPMIWAPVGNSLTLIALSMNIGFSRNFRAVLGLYFFLR